MTPERREEILQVLEECAKATRTHEFLIGAVNVHLFDTTRANIAEGMAATATKLEILRDCLMEDVYD